MLRRVALVLLLLAASGLAAIFAAGRFGVTLPWDIASSTAPDSAPKAAAPASKDREQAAAGKDEPATKSAEAVIDQTVAALGTGKTDEPKPSSGNVEIDISRISPDGSSVFAGRAEPDTYVTVMENGKPAGTVKSDEQGEWSLVTDHKFASTDPSLSFSTSKTPPPAPEPPKTQVAAAVPANPASPSAVASDVMRKFENLVSEAREEAEKSAHGTQETGKKIEGGTPAASPTPTTPEAAPSSSTTATSSSSTAETSVAANSTSTTAEQDATASASTSASGKTAAAETTDRSTTVIPVPIMFVYNEAILTPEGERAARLLLEYLTLKRLSAVELTGHADERGTNEYNFDLSRDRLNTVSTILRDGGYTGELKLTPKGKTEPFMGVNRSAYAGEALYQLDRRVELRVTR